MNYLLDTHTLIWIVNGNTNKLSEKAASIFLNEDNEFFLSPASYWELCIKVGLNKIDLGQDWKQVFSREIEANSIHWLPISMAHCEKTLELSFIHRDPFDRMLIAQAMVDDLSILTADKQISQYSVSTVW